MSKTDAKVDSIETEPEIEPLEKRPPIDVFKLSDHGRALVARVARTFDGDPEDLAAHKAIFDKWAEEVQVLLRILKIEHRGIRSIDDPRLGFWELVPIPPELSFKLGEMFVKECNREAGFGSRTGNWTWEAEDRRNNLICEKVQDLIVSAAWGRIAELEGRPVDEVVAEAEDVARKYLAHLEDE